MMRSVKSEQNLGYLRTSAQIIKANSAFYEFKRCFLRGRRHRGLTQIVTAEEFRRMKPDFGGKREKHDMKSPKHTGEVNWGAGPGTSGRRNRMSGRGK